MISKSDVRPVVPPRPHGDLEKVRNFLAELREQGIAQVPPERELVGRVGLTRSRLRSALRKLADEGLIWREVGNGTFFGQRPLAGIAETGELSNLTNPREVMEARLVLEPELAHLAAFRARQHHITELETCLEKMRHSPSRGDWTFWDQRFHYTIGQAADNTLLLVLFETVQKNMGRGTWGQLTDKLEGSSTEGSMRDHEAIFDPIRNRNPDGARLAMISHLRRVEKIYFAA
jgi:DNA-binding FadR family transcriptional regulator